MLGDLIWNDPRAIGYLWSPCLEVNIFNHVSKSEGYPFPSVSLIDNIPLLKALRVDSRLL